MAYSTAWRAIWKAATRNGAPSCGTWFAGLISLAWSANLGQKEENTSMEWSDEANEILEALLRELPAPVRSSVQEAARSRAESLAADAGEDEVAMETAVRAFVECTPADLRQRLKHTLTYHGIDPEDYDVAFST
jgi:hypothetical protein